MARGKKKRPAEEKRSIELTDDEALERLFGKEVRDKLKEVAGKADKYEKSRLISKFYMRRYLVSSI